MEENKPLLQQILDNPWILLALGVIVPTISYTVWGAIEMLNLSKMP